MINVQCTWGEGPDIMVEFKDEHFILYEKVNPKGWKHGFVKSGSFDLTADAAIQFANNLILAAKQAKQLENDIEIAEWKEKIDNMTHSQMAAKYRFTEAGHPIFRFPLFDYFMERFNKLGGFTPRISKQIGW